MILIYYYYYQFSSIRHMILIYAFQLNISIRYKIKPLKLLHCRFVGGGAALTIILVSLKYLHSSLSRPNSLQTLLSLNSLIKYSAVLGLLKVTKTYLICLGVSNSALASSFLAASSSLLYSSKKDNYKDGCKFFISRMYTVMTYISITQVNPPALQCL